MELKKRPPMVFEDFWRLGFCLDLMGEWMHGGCHLLPSETWGAIRAQMASWTHILRKIMIHPWIWKMPYQKYMGYGIFMKRRIYLKTVDYWGAGMWWYHHGHFPWHSKPHKHFWTANSLEGPPLVAGNALPRSYRWFSWWVFPWCSKYFLCLLVPSFFVLCVFGLMFFILYVYFQHFEFKHVYSHDV